MPCYAMPDQVTGDLPCARHACNPWDASCVAVWLNGRVEICANDQGNRITPSYVAWTPDGQRLVGDAAKNQVRLGTVRFGSQGEPDCVFVETGDRLVPWRGEGFPGRRGVSWGFCVRGRTFRVPNQGPSQDQWRVLNAESIVIR